MKKLITLLILIAPFLSYGQASKIISTQANPLSVADPNIAIVNLLDTPVAGGNLYRFYIAVKDSIRWNVFQIRGVKDSSQNWGDMRYAQLLGAYTNPAFVNSLSAAKVFGLSSVATTGAYSDLTGLPNLSLYYLNSNPNGYISGITSGRVTAALGFTPYNSTNPNGYISSASLSGYWLKNDTINNNYTTQYRLDSVKSALNAQTALKLSISGFTTTAINSLYGYTPYSSLNPANYITSSALSPYQLQINGTGFVKANGATINYDNSTYLTSVPAQSFASLTGKPITLSGYGITDATSNARSSISLTTTGTGAATYNNGTGVLNVPTFSQYTSSINSVTRTINSSTYTISSLQSTVYYTIQISCTASIGSNASGTVLLQYSTNSGSSWNDAGTVSNSNTVTLAIALNSVTTQTCVLSAPIPANALCRLVPTTAGTTTITWIKGSEVY